MKLENSTDPGLNYIPDGIKHIHIMGICGTGMAALAGMLKKSGYKISGSDNNVYPPMSDFLLAEGIEVTHGYSPQNLIPVPDLVVVGNVIRASNPEAQKLVEIGVPHVSMPQALAHFFLDNKKSLVVAGTHGKTTTASLLATALAHAGDTPGFMIGGIVEAFGSNFSLGKNDCFVVEGDEYDTAYFDKGSKFLHYQPHNAILTSLEFDHADIFKDLDQIKASFKKFVALIPKDGLLIACYNDANVREIAKTAPCPVVSYGTGEDCHWRVQDFHSEGLETSFKVFRDQQFFGDFTLPMPGVHNGLNCTAVIALMDHLGYSCEKIRKSILSFPGVKRRQQIRGEVGGITVIDDFAHHPTAVRETVRALRMAWPERRLVIVFEPRTNSSRRAIFQEKYASSFCGADLVIVREHIPLENVPPGDQFSSQKLVASLQKNGIEAHYFPDTDNILQFLKEKALSGDIIAVLSNGGFDDIHKRLLACLAKKSL